MKKIRMQHNLAEHELEDILTKSLAAVRSNRENTKFEDGYMESLSKTVMDHVSQQMNAMLDRIDTVINESSMEN